MLQVYKFHAVVLPKKYALKEHYRSIPGLKSHNTELHSIKLSYFLAASKRAGLRQAIRKKFRRRLFSNTNR